MTGIARRIAAIALAPALVVTGCTGQTDRAEPEPVPASIAQAAATTEPVVGRDVGRCMAARAALVWSEHTGYDNPLDRHGKSSYYQEAIDIWQQRRHRLATIRRAMIEARCTDGPGGFADTIADVGGAIDSIDGIIESVTGILELYE